MRETLFILREVLIGKDFGRIVKGHFRVPLSTRWRGNQCAASVLALTRMMRGRRRKKKRIKQI